MLLKEIIKYASNPVDLLNDKTEIKEIFLHVQVNNDDALSFYAKQGFANVGLVPGYYKRIEPSDCYLLSFKVGGSQ